MNDRLLAQINFKNHNYKVYIDEDSLIIKEHIPFEEIDNILTILYKALYVNNKNSINIDKKTIDGKTYDIYYDLLTKNYYWSNANDRVNELLNYRYNNIPLKIYSLNDEISNNTNKTYTKIVRIGKTLATIVLMGAISLNTLSNKQVVIDETPYTLAEYTVDDSLENVNAISYDAIKEIIEKNSNFSSEEKDLINKLEFVFNEFQKYMDMDLVLSRLKTLDIVYSPEAKLELVNGNYQENKKIMAEYDKEKNIIYFYQCSFLNELLSRNGGYGVFYHEFFHSLQDPENFNYFLELSTECFTREMIRRMVEMNLLDGDLFKTSTVTYSFSNGYNNQVYLYYLLGNLISHEASCDYMFSGDVTILANSLVESDNPHVSQEERYARAYNLIENFNDLRNITLQEITDKDALEKVMNSLLEKMNYYYEQSKGYSLYDSLEMALTNLQFASRPNKSILGTMLFEYFEKASNQNLSNPENLILYYGYLPKSYFSDIYPYDLINSSIVVPFGEGINNRYSIYADEYFKDNYLEKSLENKNGISR